MILSLILISCNVVSPTVVAQESLDNIITITVKSNSVNTYDKTEIYLKANTEYTLILINEQKLGHNLRIDINDNLERTGYIDDPDDIVIGLSNDKVLDENESYTGSWQTSWTTPVENAEVVYYCGFYGNFEAGMRGIFVIGDGEIPGFILEYSIYSFLFLIFTTRITPMRNGNK